MSDACSPHLDGHGQLLLVDAFARVFAVGVAHGFVCFRHDEAARRSLHFVTHLSLSHAHALLE